MHGKCTLNTDTLSSQAGMRMLPKQVTKKVTNDRGRGDRGIEFDNRDHSQIGPRDTMTLEECTRGV